MEIKVIGDINEPVLRIKNGSFGHLRYYRGLSA